MLFVSVRNIETVDNIATYRYAAFVNDKKISDGEISGFDRDDGAAVLLLRVSQDMMRKSRDELLVLCDDLIASGKTRVTRKTIELFDDNYIAIWLKQYGLLPREYPTRDL